MAEAPSAREGGRPGWTPPLGTSEQVAIRNDQLMVSYSNGGGGFAYESVPGLDIVLD